MTAIPITALVRAPFQPLEVAESWDTELLKEAAALLGYKPSAVAEAETVRARSVEENIFAHALKAVDIQPFTVQSVLNYKKMMLKAAHKPQSWSLTRYMHSTDGEAVSYRVGIPAMLGTGAAFVLAGSLRWGGYDHWDWDGAHSIKITEFISQQTFGWIMALPVAALAVWGFLMYLRHKEAMKINAAWVAAPVDRYYSPIPAFAVQRMISLKKELPAVTFSVEQLNSRQEYLDTEKAPPPPPPPDPFLIATFRGVSAYIDVWDEPKFEGRRTL